MPKVQPCPKCGHLEILVVPHIADRDDRDEVRPLTLYVRHRDWRDDEHGQFQAHVCRGCGYTELYIANAGHLPVDKMAGAKIVKAKKSAS
jgi:predicted nucleic-acid-binding Zn-ribbon protein